MEKEVFFYSNKVKLRGTVCTPKNNAGNLCFPVAVLSHGYELQRMNSGFCNAFRVLNEIGIASFRFDFRGCGDSDYQLGRMLCNSEWVEDLNNAVSFICSFDGIDKNKVCLIERAWEHRWQFCLQLWTIG